MNKHEILRLLPGIFQHTVPTGEEDNLLMGLLAVMERHHQPVEAVLDGMDQVFNPEIATSPFLSLMAQMVGLGELVSPIAGSELIPNGRLRDLILTAVELAQLRGTKKGLQQMLEAATGMAPYIIQDDPHTPYHIIIRCPVKALSHLRLLRQIISLEKPAYVTYQLESDHAPNGSTPRDWASIRKEL